MKVRVNCPFRDFEEGVARGIGDTFECSDDRAAKLVENGLASVVEHEKKPAQARRRTRKTK